ncbi:hypothetical protein [Sphaerisporangium rufum]|nr:hypothetical protein [Sphaerisporangium rufum]
MPAVAATMAVAAGGVLIAVLLRPGGPAGPVAGDRPAAPPAAPPALAATPGVATAAGAVPATAPPPLPPAGPARSAMARPAPSRDEEARATRLLLADPRLGPIVRAMYEGATGHPPGSARELRVHALIFRRHGCEVRRCLQLFVRFPGGAWLDVGRVIVDLTGGTVRVLPW